MNKIKLLVTGTAMAGPERSVCSTCNYDMDWLFKYPSNLIWSDKIIITKFMNDTIESAHFPDDGGPVAIAMNKIFEIAKQYDIIEIKNPEKIISKTFSESIAEEVMFDRDVLSKLFPSNITLGEDSSVPGQIFIEGEEYCLAHIWSIYASLILSKQWEAKPLFSQRTINYCKYKFGSSIVKENNYNLRPNVFDTILSLSLPEKEIFPYYVGGTLCKKCANVEKCDNTYLFTLESNLHDYLKLRDYDEMNQTKDILYKIINKLEKEKSLISHSDIINEFKIEEMKARKLVNKIFPKIKRWTNIGLMSSIAATAAGTATGLPFVSLFGASMTGLTAAAKEFITYKESKYKWIGFLNKESVNKN